ncbi:MAG: hypothetical protein IJP29_00785 [Lachnospiraceae bacterium]|nr:hypothetical protein [Lachnospiraceae bacterium]
MGKFKAFLVMIALWAALFFLIFDPTGVQKNYDERGIEVTATITEVTNGVKMRKYYTCTYYNDVGQEVTARLTLNRFGGEVGQVVEGKYLPETPEHVYCEASTGLKIGVAVFFLVLAICATIGFFGNTEGD